jgi:hypothetical protein
MRRHILRITLALVVGLGFLAGFVGEAAAQSPYPPGMTEPEICRSEVMWARSAASIIDGDCGQRLRRFIDTGYTFLRYDRRQEAIRRPGVEVRVEEQRIGLTGRDSSITARVPSATIEILAIDAPYMEGRSL